MRSPGLKAAAQRELDEELASADDLSLSQMTKLKTNCTDKFISLGSGCTSSSIHSLIEGTAQECRARADGPSCFFPRRSRKHRCQEKTTCCGRNKGHDVDHRRMFHSRPSRIKATSYSSSGMDKREQADPLDGPTARAHGSSAPETTSTIMSAHRQTDRQTDRKID